MLHVVVAEDTLLAAAAPYACDHRGVVLLVGEDYEARDEMLDGGQCRIIGIVSGGEQERRLLAVQVGKLGLELDMIMGGAGDVAGAAGARAHRLDRLVHGAANHGVLAHAEIVVGAPDGHLVGAAMSEMVGGWIGSAVALQVGEDAVAALATQGLKVLAEKTLIIHV